jgi:branched-chain amino acid transport system substrate-binding protein
MRHVGRKTLSFVALGCLLLATAALAAPAKKAPSGQPIKIGAILSVTGPNSPLGDPEKKTVDVLVHQINNAGGVLGRPLQVIVKDDRSQTQDASIAAKDLVENEKVVAIIGPSGTPSTMAIKDYCQKQGTPLVSCAAGKTITSPVASYVFATPQTNTLAAEKIFTQLAKARTKNVAILSVSDGFGTDGLANLEATAKKRKIPVVAKESFDREATDVSAQLTRIKAKNPAALIVWGTNPGPAIATKSAKTLGLECPIIQSHGVANSKFLELAGSAANGVQLPAGRLIVNDQISKRHPQKKVLDSFANSYKGKYRTTPNTFAGHAYDALMMVVQAITKAGSTDRAKVRTAIEQIRNFVGTAGTFNYSPSDHNGLTVEAFVWVKIQGGKWKLAE